MPHIGQPGFGAKDISKNVGVGLVVVLFLLLLALLTVYFSVSCTAFS
jgi:hypothetical protein